MMKSQVSEKHARFVSFSGIDGAGKSSQIKTLFARLTNHGVRVQVITFWDDVAQLKRLREGAGHRLFKGDKGVGAPEAPISRRDKNVRSWPMTCFRIFLYLLDALALRRIVARAGHSQAQLIIFDRYIYDELANLKLNSVLARAYVRLVLKLVPEPDVSLLLDADPMQAHARKPEYPLEFTCLNRQSYMQLSRLVGGMITIPPMSIEDVEREVLSRTLYALSHHAGDRSIGTAAGVTGVRHTAT